MQSPVLLEQIFMIDKVTIEALVKEKIEGTEVFLVDVKIDSSNNINVYVDSEKGISVDTCVEISKHVEQSFDREEEDFALEVSSPGIGGAFKVYKQYEKVINKTVEVLFLNGEKVQGTLQNLNKDNFTIEYSVKEKPEGAKRPIWVDKKQTINFSEIKSTKEIITF